MKSYPWYPVPSWDLIYSINTKTYFIFLKLKCTHRDQTHKADEMGNVGLGQEYTCLRPELGSLNTSEVMWECGPSVGSSSLSICRASLILQIETLYPLDENAPFLPPPQPLATTILLSMSMDLMTLDTSHDWNHSICPFVTGSFYLANVFRV